MQNIGSIINIFYVSILVFLLQRTEKTVNKRFFSASLSNHAVLQNKKHTRLYQNTWSSPGWRWGTAVPAGSGGGGTAERTGASVSR